jgi:hypothetical protein
MYKLTSIIPLFLFFFCLVLFLYNIKDNFTNIQPIYIYINSGQGLFSAINEIVKAHVYAKKNNLELIIIDKDWNYGSWNNYFEKSLKTTSIYEKDINLYTFIGSSSKPTSYEEMKESASIIFMPKNKELFVYPALEDKKYISVHIRKGDKISTGESGFISNDIYIKEIYDKCKELNIINVYYATDDIENLTEIMRKLPNLNHYYNNNNRNKTGYNNSNFNNLSSNDKKIEFDNMMIDFFTIVNSDFFICTFSSNVSRFVALYRDPTKCKSLDTKWSCCLH